MKRLAVLIVVLAVVGSAVAGVLLSVREAEWTAPAGNVIGVIYIEGPILGGSVDDLFGGAAGADRITGYLEEARQDPAVRAVVLRLNSPGGSVAASQEIAVEVERLREADKLVVASMGDIAASGAYWIAAHADYVMAMPGTTTGSIGVIASTLNMEELYEKLGLEQVVFKSGPHKDMLSPTRQITDEERALVQAMIDDMYEQFVRGVVEGRAEKMTEEEVRRIADGRVVTGRQALDLGLVDELANWRQAIERTAELAGIAESYRVIEYSETGWSRLLSGRVQALSLLPGRDQAPALWRWPGLGSLR